MNRTDYALARQNMVESQVRTNRVTDARLIAAMSELPRELFVPESQRGIAYVDEDISIGDGRYLMEPMVLARLLQAAEAGPHDLALEIGCGTGYGAAVIGRLCGAAIALESDARLAARAVTLLGELGIDNVAVADGPLAGGYQKQAPYDVILFSGGVAEVPQAIMDQLADGGRLVAVVDRGRGMGQATLFIRRSGTVSSRVLFDAATPLLPGFEKQEGFVF